MSKKSDTGEPTEYGDDDAAALEAAADEAWANYDASGGGGEPTKMTVSAQVEWSGVVDRARGGHRTTRLDNLETAPVRKALSQARAANARAETATPATSYRAKGWHAQLRELTGSKYGSTAADKAGLNPSGRAVKEWLSESRNPSKANQEKISEAYNALRNRRVEEATERAKKANGVVAEILSTVFRSRYGAEIRLRDITDMELDD